jgi:heat shock protein HtpX
VVIDDAIRRNRWRIVLLTAGSVANWCLLTGTVAYLWIWNRGDSPDPGLFVEISTSAAIGAAIAGLAIGYQLWAIGRTVGRIGAVEVGETELPVLRNLVEELSIATGVPRPRVALLADGAPNAMAVGRSPSRTTIVVTSGLVVSLARDELEAVLAAELWAVRRLDTAMQTAAVACSGSAISFHHAWRNELRSPRTWIIVVLTWPTMAIAELLRRSVHRNADFGADELAVATTRHPHALRRALEKLRDHTGVVAALDARTAPLWFEPLPHDDPRRAGEMRRLRLSPTLTERLDRLPGGPS